MSADDKASAAWDDYIDQQQEEKIEELERELNAANERIKRLEEVGDDLICYLSHHVKTDNSDSIWHIASIKWGKAKKAKP